MKVILSQLKSKLRVALRPSVLHCLSNQKCQTLYNTSHQCMLTQINAWYIHVATHKPY